MISFHAQEIIEKHNKQFTDGYLNTKTIKNYVKLYNNIQDFLLFKLKTPFGLAS